MRHHYPRRPCEYFSAHRSEGVAKVSGDVGGATAEREAEDVALRCLRVSCRDLRNFAFRAALEDALHSGLLAAALRIHPPLKLRAVSRPGGVACSGRRHALVEVRPVASALDATLALTEEGHCVRPGLIFAAHASRGEVISREETELIARTNWATAFLDAAACRALKAEAAALAAPGDVPLGHQARSRSEAGSQAAESAPCLEAGSTQCLVAQELLVLRAQSGQPSDAPPRLLEAAVAFLPQLGPALAPGLCGYKDVKDRLAYKRQVEACLTACCLLDLDSLCIGCAEGVAGSALYGHPLRETAEVWREVLHEKAISASGATFGAQFKRVLFAVAEDVPFSAIPAAQTLRETFSEHLAP